MELALDERAHLRVLFPGEQGGARGKTELQVGASRLAQRGVSGLLVEDIVDKL